MPSALHSCLVRPLKFIQAAFCLLPSNWHAQECSQSLAPLGGMLIELSPSQLQQLMCGLVAFTSQRLACAPAHVVLRCRVLAGYLGRALQTVASYHAAAGSRIRGKYDVV